MAKKKTGRQPGFRVMVQPEDGMQHILDALKSAKKSIHILIFRLDRREIERELLEAVERGVAVQALIAYTNRGGEANLRQFEQRLLGHGVTVSRTADDLIRYHGKMFIIDEKVLHLLAFNYTHMDMQLSRSFAIATRQPKAVREALKLFEADSKRTEYKCGDTDLVVSPCNARERLRDFIAGAKKELLMYEMQVSDRQFVNLLNEKIDQGVSVRVLGKKAVKGGRVPTRVLPMRLHARAILRDGSAGFLGSMSLRKLELEARREIGLIFHDVAGVQKMRKVFMQDWKKSAPVVEADEVTNALRVPAKKVAKNVAKELDLKSTVAEVLDGVIDSKAETPFEPDEVAQTVKDAFREQVEEAVTGALKKLVLETAQKQLETSTGEGQGK